MKEAKDEEDMHQMKGVDGGSEKKLCCIASVQLQCSWVGILSALFCRHVKSLSEDGI